MELWHLCVCVCVKLRATLSSSSDTDKSKSPEQNLTETSQLVPLSLSATSEWAVCTIPLFFIMRTPFKYSHSPYSTKFLGTITKCIVSLVFRTVDS